MGATIQGPGGAFTTDAGLYGKISGWSGTINIGQADTTGFTDNGNVVVEGVDVQITGSAAGTLVSGSGSSSAPSGGLGATPTMSSWNGNVTLTAYSGGTFSFPALFTSVAINRPARGKGDVTFSFSSRGAITQAWT